ncbi:MAG: SpoIVB peptidase [Oscillospiraceae bacterium]|nr:SpoIVB peptidase [Oscillospiraceae bacterium]
MKKIVHICSFICFVLSTLILTMACAESFNLPMEVKITENCKKIEFSSKFPLTTDINMDYIEGGTKPTNKTYDAKVKLLNIFPVKNLNVKIVDEKFVIPGGDLFGIKIFTEGVVVVGTPGVQTNGGLVNPAIEAGILLGDVITKIGSEKVDSNESIARLIEESDGDLLTVVVKRNEMVFTVELRPAISKNDNRKRAGMQVRDSSAGIGTLSLLDSENNRFCGLGHGICDVDVKKLLTLAHGEVTKVCVNDVKRGEKGSPGELRGRFDGQDAIGTLDCNSETGVYGRMDKKNMDESKKMPVAMKQQVKIGKAKILCTVTDNKQESFDMEIVEVNYKADSPRKNIIVRITDPKLLEKTGGIVQGMSGSPIIQDNKIAGVVTHVLVNDPTMGYAIFAENMLTQLEEFQDYDN